MTDNTKEKKSFEKHREKAIKDLINDAIRFHRVDVLEAIFKEEGVNILDVFSKRQEIDDLISYNKSGRAIVHSLELMREMQNRGMNLSTWKDEQGKTLLHYAAFYHLSASVETLIEAGVNVNVQDNEGNTPLHDFVMTEFPSTQCSFTLESLLSHGVALNIKNNEGKTPIDIALFNGLLGIYATLVNSRNKGMFVPKEMLMQASFDNDAAFMTDFFLKPNERKEFGRKDDLIGRRVKYDYELGWCPEECASYLLLCAVHNNAKDVVEVLLNKEDPCIMDKEGCSLFGIAVLMGHLDTVKVLLNDKRTDINYAGNNDFSPLKYAICTGKTEIAKLLLNDERIQISDKAFLLRCSEKYPDIMKLLEKIEETPQKECKVHRLVCMKAPEVETELGNEEVETEWGNEEERQSSVKIS
ncbi:MAG: ankyrin repeat domain-containing protein, partial [Alphaproteobacteria bacterium]|nr:ankyrin repeat domain-containing protein [Alphaproteobacteria bacterium]